MFGQVELLTALLENGIVAAAFLYILHWLLNKQSRELESQFKTAQITNLEVAKAIRSLVSAVLGMQQQLMTHDLTVTGLNPSTGTNFEERDSMAFKRYTEVMKKLDEQRQIIHSMNLESDNRMEEIRATSEE
jgi:hypothetical protein